MTSFRFCPKCGSRLAAKVVEEHERLVCASCAFIFYENPKPTASAVIVQAGRVLLVRRAVEPHKGSWDLPGGFLEKDEHPETALRREIKEELGIEIEVLELLGIYIDTYGYDETGGHTLNIYYLASITSGEPRPASDIDDTGWLDAGEIPSDMAFENNRQALLAWQKRLSASSTKS